MLQILTIQCDLHTQQLPFTMEIWSNTTISQPSVQGVTSCFKILFCFVRSCTFFTASYLCIANQCSFNGNDTKATFVRWMLGCMQSWLQKQAHVSPLHKPGVSQIVRLSSLAQLLVSAKHDATCLEMLVCKGCKRTDTSTHTTKCVMVQCIPQASSPRGLLPSP